MNLAINRDPQYGIRCIYESNPPLYLSISYRQRLILQLLVLAPGGLERKGGGFQQSTRIAERERERERESKTGGLRRGATRRIFLLRCLLLCGDHSVLCSTAVSFAESVSSERNPQQQVYECRRRDKRSTQSKTSDEKNSKNMSTVMSNFGKIVSYAFNSLDMSSAANDVVVVRHQDGTLHSSPFNVRFGKVKVINPGEKVVMIEVNGKVTSAVMKMGPDGVAYWLRPTMHAPERPESPLESPNQRPATLLSGGSLDSPPSFALDAPRQSKSPPGSLPPAVSSPRSPQIAAVPGEPIPGGVLPPLAPVSVEDVAFEQMSGKEKARFEELYQSFARSEQAAVSSGPSTGSCSAAAESAASGEGNGGLTLSKFASYDDLAVGASGTPSTAAGTEAGGIGVSLSTPAEDAEEGDDDDYDGEYDDLDDDNGSVLSDAGSGSGDATGPIPPVKIFFKQTLTPIHVDLMKLGLKDGINYVRYSTPTTLRGRVIVEARIFLYTSTDKIVISDIDGTVTKSDVWGHLLPLIGRDWTHPGICSLYTKIAQNGYRILYLTARSVSQVEQTRQFLWGIEQAGVRLPQGPVFTAPDRFFTALTQEVTKKAHEFKIACLQSILHAFPQHSKPFYAGFGNRIGDVISYTATGIPKHKIFIIDTNSVLHVCHVRQSYKDLAHLVDHTFPPLAARQWAPTAAAERPSDSASTGNRSASPDVAAANSLHNSSNGGLREGESVDQDYNNFNYWRIPPEQLIRARTPPPSPVPHVGAGPSSGASGGVDAVVTGSAEPSARHGVGEESAEGKKRGIWSKLWKSSGKDGK